MPSPLIPTQCVFFRQGLAGHPIIADSRHSLHLHQILLQRVQFADDIPGDVLVGGAGEVADPVPDLGVVDVKGTVNSGRADEVYFDRRGLPLIREKQKGGRVWDCTGDRCQKQEKKRNGEFKLDSRQTVRPL